MKLFYVDTETTGVDPKVHDIIQLACLVEVDQKVVDQRCWFIKPFNWNTIDPKALECSGTTMDDLKSDKYMFPQDAYRQIYTFLCKYINPRDREDKFTPAGYNTPFDTQMLREFFHKNNDKYYGSFFLPWDVCVYRMFNAFRAAGLVLNVPNMKLETLCRRFNVPIDAHDAISDITATRQLFLLGRALFINNAYITSFNKEQEKSWNCNT